MPEPRRNSIRSDLAHVMRGFCMGCADIVPGVSGGTVALVVGIYERLVTALSHFDLTLVEHLLRRRWSQAGRHIDLRFLLSLLLGIAAGFLVMTVLMNRLLTNAATRSMTLAAFLGLILGSALVIALMIRVDSWKQGLRCLALGALGAAFAFWVTTLEASSHEPSYAYIFLCGALAICAMILPGISGAMILLILGVYVHLTEIPRNLLHGQQVAQGLLTILVFGVAAGSSLITFSKFLRWLLARYHAATVAVLCGFMIGALPKLWPFQKDLTPEKEFKYKQFELVLPETVDVQVILATVILVVALASVFVVDRFARRSQDG